MNEEFPVRGLLPKDETQVGLVLAKNPEYDGRNTIIAILDTGVDPAAPGLAITTDGKPKIFDVVDCTGSGDVKLSAAQPATSGDSGEGQFLPGLSGRKLKLNKSWKNPKNEWRLGLKHSSELFPKALIERLKDSRKEKFEIERASCETATLSLNAGFDKNDTSVAAEDARARKDVLQKLWKNFTDNGTFFDCIVWHDGATWRAAVDTGAEGDLSGEPALTNFADENQFHYFSLDTMLTFSVNIYDNGSTLSIVAVAGSHGTHVAAIAAAHYPEQPDLNGVAPGAQIVSLKIGDTRLGSMETGSGLIRAATYLANFKRTFGVRVDIANMSYGEAVGVPDFGRFIELVQDKVINEQECVFVSSAGNNGPGLTTLGSPGGSSTQIIGVGAFVTEQMVQAEYALSKQPRQCKLPFTWSSRPVAANGDIGADIYAPGAAITSVPQYTTQKTQLMNGTSMSSPNAAGCLGVLLSALKAEKIQYNPYMIRHALINASKSIGDSFEVGFLQVASSLNFLRLYSKEPELAVFYKRKGVYLREREETNTICNVSLNVQPHFINSSDPAVNKRKLDLELHLAVQTDVDWIEAPAFFHLNNGGRALPLVIDPTSLEENRVYFTQVRVFNPAKPFLGPLLTIPVTVCKPLQPQPTLQFSKLKFDSGVIRRQLISVPDGANFAQVTISSVNRSANARFLLHLIQLEPQARYSKHEAELVVQLGANGLENQSNETNEVRKWIRVIGGVTLEACLAQFWSSADPSQVSIGFEFHGVHISSSPGLIRSGFDGVSRHILSSSIRKEALELSVSLDKLERALRPTDAVIKPLQSRDVLPDGRQVNELLLTFEFKVADAACTNIKLYFPKLNSVLYDSVFESVLLAVYDPHGQLLSFQDIYSKSIKLNAGEGPYTVQLQVTSCQPTELLEPLLTQVLVVEHSLPKPVSTPIAQSLADLLRGNGSTKMKLNVQKGERLALFIGAAELPKGAKPGDVLTGSLKLFSKSEGGAYTIDASSKLCVNYPVPPPEPKSTPSVSTAEKEPEIEHAVRDYKLQLLQKIVAVSKKIELIDEILSSSPKHVPAQQAKVQILFESVVAGSEQSSYTWTDVSKACDELLGLIDVSRLERYFAVKHPASSSDASEKEEKQEREKERDSLVFGLSTKLRALIQIAILSDSQDARDACKEFYEQKVQPWAPEPTDAKMVELMVLYHSLGKHYGLALKLTMSYLSEPKNVAQIDKSGPDYKRIYDLQERLLSDCGYDFWAKYYLEQKLKCFVKAKIQF